MRFGRADYFSAGVFAMMAYMKWVSLIRDAVSEQQEKGMLGVLAATTEIQEYRLREWVTKKTIDDLSHAELTAIHDALSERITVEGDHNGLSAQPPERSPQYSFFEDRSCAESGEDSIGVFDSSD
jgi:hypothetical protein